MFKKYIDPEHFFFTTDFTDGNLVDTFQSFSCGCGSVCVLHSVQNIEKHCKNQYIKISKYNMKGEDTCMSSASRLNSLKDEYTY